MSLSDGFDVAYGENSGESQKLKSKAPLLIDMDVVVIIIKSFGESVIIAHFAPYFVE